MDIKHVFPRIKYHEKHARDGMIVRDAEHEKNLEKAHGAGWVETPAHFGKAGAAPAQAASAPALAPVMDDPKKFPRKVK